MTKLFTKSSRDGYIEIDHRESPGISREQARLLGDSTYIVPGNTVFKGKTFMCPKCQKTIIRNPDRDRSRGYCRKCDHDVCDGCALLLKLNHVCTFDTCWHVKQINVT